MSDWKPIETAPKDREIMIVRNGKIRIGKWDDDRYNKKPRPYWRDHQGRNISTMRYLPPTHWMPLPEPPTP
jgi:hypothetical protein